MRGNKEGSMASDDLDSKINTFLRRKEAEFPELAAHGRSNVHTAKYAVSLRLSGQQLLTY